MSVTSSGRSPMSRTMRWMSAWFWAMPLAMSLRMKVLPAFGGETMSPRWPRPMGAIRLITRWERLSEEVSRSISLSGKMAVSCSKWGRRSRLVVVHAVDRLDAQEAVVLLVVLGGAHGAGNVVAGAQAKAPHLGLRDVDVTDAGQVVHTAQEAVAAFVQDLQDACTEDLAFALRLVLQDAVNIVLLMASPLAHLQAEASGDVL